MALLPPNHADRIALAAEAHARPPEPLETPSHATYIAVLVDHEKRAQELEHLATLCTHYGVAGPAATSTHFSAMLASVRVKWERHSEFSGYTFFTSGSSPEPFDGPPTDLLPQGWLAAVPGVTVAAAHAELLPAGLGVPDVDRLAAHFAGNIVVGAEIGDGAGLAYTDFRIHADGCSRFLVLNRSFTPQEAGRMLQRLFEIEAYRMMALLALPIARRQSPRIVSIEKSLSALTDRMAEAGATAPGTAPTSRDEALLHQLTRLAAEVESELAASQYRFGACKAYFELVTRRVTELREVRLDAVQTIEEFMARRFTPAVNTCSTVSQRLHSLSERVAQASALLSARVEIAREGQNQSLLVSMNRRARMQLRLQQTVEGLSVAAIVYYVAGLAGYLAKALRSMGLRVEPDIVVGAAIPVVAAIALLGLHKVRQQIARDEPGDQTQAY